MAEKGRAKREKIRSVGGACAHAETTIFSSGLRGEPILQKWFSPHNKHTHKPKFEVFTKERERTYIVMGA